MTRWAVGDIQGCDEELGLLLRQVRFNADRDQLWCVGDLVNRGPRSLQVLRRLYRLRDNVSAVLGNHDLHLLAVALADGRRRSGDTLDDILAARDRDQLIGWLLYRPLAHAAPPCTDLLVHAGVLPQWDVAQTLARAHEVEQALRHDPRHVLSQMYGNDAEWRGELAAAERWRATINALTRLRFCSDDGRMELKLKGPPDSAPPPWKPWFDARPIAREQARIIFGHWSALGLLREHHLLALDTGCVWGGALTAIDLDDPGAEPVSVASRQPRSTEF